MKPGADSQFLALRPGVGSGINILFRLVAGGNFLYCTSTGTKKQATRCAQEKIHKKFTISGRAHNNANVLCLGERVTGPGVAADLADIFLNTDFEGGRHLRRVELFDKKQD